MVGLHHSDPGRAVRGCSGDTAVGPLPAAADQRHRGEPVAHGAPPLAACHAGPRDRRLPAESFPDFAIWLGTALRSGRMDRRRSIVRLAAAAAVTTAALWLAARNVRVDRVRSALGDASFVWLLPYPIICIVLNVIRGEIWRMLLGRRVTTAQAFWAYSVGFLANNALPFRLGEAARVVVLSRRSELPVVEVAAAAGLERLLDMTALSLMLALLGPALAGVPGFMRAATLVAMLAGVALLAIVALIRFRRQSRVVFESATGWLPATAGRIAIERWNDLTHGLA